MNYIDLSQGTAKAIDSQVSKILRGLGNPEPPLDLDAVFELLKLDQQYYTTSEDGVVRETISRVKVGAKLVFSQPVRIFDAIKKLDLQALYIPGRRRVLIDSSLHEKKKRWDGAHEILHSCLDWHEDYTWGDTQGTLNLACREQIEAEANYGAGRLLFLQDKFEKEVKGIRHTLKGLGGIAKRYDNSWTSTLYRTAETLDIPAFAVIGSHPRYAGEERVRHLVCSPPFRQRFSNITEEQIVGMLASYCTYRTRGPLGHEELTIADDRGDSYSFSFESFGTPGGDVLTLAQCVGKIPSFVSLSR